MTVQSHIHSLRARHAELDEQIKELMSGTALDDGAISDLKRKKLQLKDRIRELSEQSVA